MIFTVSYIKFNKKIFSISVTQQKSRLSPDGFKANSLSTKTKS